MGWLLRLRKGIFKTSAGFLGTARPEVETDGALSSDPVGRVPRSTGQRRVQPGSWVGPVGNGYVIRFSRWVGSRRTTTSLRSSSQENNGRWRLPACRKRAASVTSRGSASPRTARPAPGPSFHRVLCFGIQLRPTKLGKITVGRSGGRCRGVVPMSVFPVRRAGAGLRLYTFDWKGETGRGSRADQKAIQGCATPVASPLGPIGWGCLRFQRPSGLRF